MEKEEEGGDEGQDEGFEEHEEEKALSVTRARAPSPRGVG